MKVTLALLSALAVARDLVGTVCRCGHLESEHQVDGPCSDDEGRDDPKRRPRCPCKGFDVAPLRVTLERS